MKLGDRITEIKELLTKYDDLKTETDKVWEDLKLKIPKGMNNYEFLEMIRDLRDTKHPEYLEKYKKYFNIEKNSLHIFGEIIDEPRFEKIGETNEEFFYFKIKLLTEVYDEKNEKYVVETKIAIPRNENNNYSSYKKGSIVSLDLPQDEFYKDYYLGSNFKIYEVKKTIEGEVGTLDVLDEKTVLVHTQFDTQGSYYKNTVFFEEQKELSKKEYEKIPLYKKIAYVTEQDVGTLIVTEDSLDREIEFGNVSTYFSIIDIIKTQIGKENLLKFTENDLLDMASDVFETLDWQTPSSLIFGDEYLEGAIEEKINQESEADDDER